jgi:hypothetical protein
VDVVSGDLDTIYEEEAFYNGDNYTETMVEGGKYAKIDYD